MKHLRSIEELGVDGIVRILSLSEHMAQVNQRPVPKVPALIGRTVVSLFLRTPLARALVLKLLPNACPLTR